MFYRVAKFKHELGKTDEIMEFFKSNEDTFKSSEGLKGVFYFKSSDKEVVGVAMWEIKLISGPPEISEGNSGYKFDRD